MSAEVSLLGALARSVQDHSVSWVNGSTETCTDILNLFVADHRHISFPFPSNEDLKSLYDIAQPAYFGRGQEAVLDNTYRSGRTLTRDKFAINLRPTADLLQQIKSIMLDTGCKSSEESDRHFVRAELHRVNLYGPGDFFKEHKDTPQTGSGHFGSLVLCLPTHFEGGAFVIRDTQQQELRFDWGKTFAESAASVPGNNSDSSSSAPSAATAATAALATIPYLAFASDLDHWVEPVVSGYRVTLTFNLFRGELSSSEIPQPRLPRSLPSTTTQGNTNPNASSFGCAYYETSGALMLKESEELRGKRVVFPLVSFLLGTYG